MRFSGLKKFRWFFTAAAIVAGVLGAYRLWDIRYRVHRDESSEHKTQEEKSEVSEIHHEDVFKVTSGVIEEYVKAPGTIDFHPKHALRVHSAFPGVVTKVFKNLGDTVKAGEALALIESNIGIQVYTVSSPIKGTVMAKNLGDGQSISPEDEIFSVGDSSILQARLAVAARDVKQIKANQEIILLAEGRLPIRAVVNFLSPILTEETRTAPIIIDIAASNLRPGMFVTGAVVTNKRQVAVVIPIELCDTDAKEITLTVVKDTILERRSVSLGARDYYHCEVTNGLMVDEQVMPANSFAAVKSEGEHEHSEE